jgi:hypothetical protein
MLDRLFDFQNLLAASAMLLAVQIMWRSTRSVPVEVVSRNAARLLEAARSNGLRRTR